MSNYLEEFWSNSMIDNSNRNLESISGVGSTLKYTENLRKELPKLFEKFSIKSIFDAPCGDMNWMNVFLKEHPIDYTGADIVDQLIRHNQQYTNKNTSIIKLDIANDTFPPADLWICRDCWFHLPDEYIFKSIDNFLKSDIKYLLTTTHINTGFKNSNLDRVNFKLIDLFLDPYSFPTPLYRIKDYYGKKAPREMVLFSKEQLIEWNKKRN